MNLLGAIRALPIPLPTTRGGVTLLLTLAAVGLSLAHANLAAGMVAAALLATILASFLLALLSLHRVEVRRGTSRAGIRGAPTDLPLTVVNRAPWRRQAVVLREDLAFLAAPRLHTPVTALGPHESRTILRRVVADRRGHYRLDPVALVGGDPAGLFRRVRHYRLPTEITIYPATTRVAWMPIRVRHQLRASADGRPLGVSGLSQEMFGVREYRPTDGVRFIHWRASARQRRLMVREFEAFSIAQVGIVLDVDRRAVGPAALDTNFEYLVELATSVADYLAGMYCRTVFVSATGHPAATVLENAPAHAARREIREFLARAEPTDQPLAGLLDEALRHMRRESILYVLGMSDAPELHHRFDLLLERGVDIRWIHAAREGFQDLPAWRRRISPAHTPAATTGHPGLAPFAVARETPIGRVLAHG
jgi:uncharacterized protein (DUF58 family)